MKKFLSVFLTVLALWTLAAPNLYAQDSENAESTSYNVQQIKPVLKLAAMFAVPVAILATIGGGIAFANHKYKNPVIVATGNVTGKEADEVLRKASEIDSDGRNVTIKFENAIIRSGAFYNKKFSCKVLFGDRCDVEPCAFKGAKFCGDFEIDGRFSEKSSFIGARFERSIIVNNLIPQRLFFGANAILNEGNVYRLPEKVLITYDGTEKSRFEVKSYLEEVYFK